LCCAYRAAVCKSLYRWFDIEYTHPSLSAVSQICWVAPRIKINHSGPSADRSTRSVRQLEQVLEPYRRMDEGLRGEKQLTSQCFWKGKKNTKNTKTLCYFFGGGEAVNYSRILECPRSGFEISPARKTRRECTSSGRAGERALVDQFKVLPRCFIQGLR